MSKNILVIILICVVIILLMTKPTYNKNEIVIKTDTVLSIKTLTKYKKGDSIPYKIIVKDKIIIQDSIKVTIHDTIRIINEYLETKAYNDTIKIDSNIFYINDTITQNKIIARKFAAKLQEKTIYITNTIKPKKEFVIGGDLRNFNNVLGASIGVGLKVPNKGLVLINYGTQGYSVGYYKKLF
jgi:hypothetical protein